MNKILRALIIALAILYSGQLSAEVPIWPLGIPILESSSFAEFRGMRFHAGVDLKTKGRTGFPVFAVADGFVSRMKVQFRGYGYALYVDHPKLNIRTVYGHLDAFALAMSDYSKKKLKKLGKPYGIDDFFSAGKFPVKKGQVIAYSGESGSGPPHLHFEVRRMNDDPISPTVIGMKIPESRPAEFRHIYFEPLSDSTRLDGQFTPLRIKISKINARSWKWSGVPKISGKTGVLAGVIDSNGLGNYFGVEKITMLVDGKKHFERSFQRFSYAKNKQCPLVYDYNRSNMSGTGYVCTMFKWPSESLPMSAGYKDWGGVLENLPIGRHSLKIVATDFGGNTIAASGEFETIPQSVVGKVWQKPVKPIRYEYLTFGLVVHFSIPETIPAGLYAKATVLDSKGVADNVPAWLSGKKGQLLFPLTPRWSDGAFFGKIKILPQFSLVGNAGGTWENQSVKVLFSSNDVYRPTFVRLTPIKLKPKPQKSKRGGGITPLSSVWGFEPGNLVAREPFSVSMPLPPGKKPSRLGFYVPRGKSSYGYIGGGAKDGRLVWTGRELNTIVMAEDSSAPYVKFKHRRKIKHLGLCWVYRVSDIGEGVSYLATRATVNGKKTLSYADPDKKEIYVVQLPGKKKLCNLVIKVFDRAGNMTQVKEKRNR